MIGESYLRPGLAQVKRGIACGLKDVSRKLADIVKRGQRGPELAQQLASSTPAERLEAARAIGADAIWAEMILPLLEEGQARAAE
jgi:hypothetical protein